MISYEIGNKYNRLLIVEDISIKGFRQYRCICDCGNFHEASRNNILRGVSKQCSNCSRAQKIKTTTTKFTKNNKYTYNSYRSILLRCSEHIRYIGTYVCPEWMDEINGFTNFLIDMGPRPKDHTIDRIDNSKGYFKENCRWATVGVQNHNKSKRVDSKTSKYIGVSLQKGKWVVQIMRDGVRHHSIHLLEIDAATHYDNVSQEWYGDRPNKTECRTIIPYKPARGGVSFDKKTNKYRARLSLPDGTRKNVGFFVTEQEAKEKLKTYLEEFYS